MREADKILRWAERNWLLLIDDVDKKSADAIALNKSENHYTQVIQYDPNKERGYAVYTYWRHHDDSNIGVPIVESKEWQVKRLENAIEHHTQQLKNHQKYFETYEQELRKLLGEDNERDKLLDKIMEDITEDKYQYDDFIMDATVEHISRWSIDEMKDFLDLDPDDDLSEL